MQTFPFLWCRSFGCFDDAKLEIESHVGVKISFINDKICYMKQFLNVMNEKYNEIEACVEGFH